MATATQAPTEAQRLVLIESHTDSVLNSMRTLKHLSQAMYALHRAQHFSAHTEQIRRIIGEVDTVMNGERMAIRKNVDQAIAFSEDYQ